MPNGYISQLIRQAATPPRAKKPSRPTEADLVPPSDAAVQAMARGIREAEDDEIRAFLDQADRNGDVFFLPPGVHVEHHWAPPEAEITGESYSRMLDPRPNENGDAFQVRPGILHGNLWWPSVIVSRPLLAVEHRNHPEAFAREHQGRFMAREEAGIGVANMAGIQRLEVSTRDRGTVLLGRREGMSMAATQAVRDALMAQEDQQIFQALDGLGRDEPFSLSSWASLGPNPVQPDPALQAERVRMPEFEIASNPTIPLSEIRERRFNLVDRNPQFFEVSWVANPATGQELRRMTPSPQHTEQSYTNVPRPYCPTSWERLLGEDPV